MRRVLAIRNSRERESTAGLFKKHKEANVLGTFNLSEMGSFEQIGK